ncbi:MAG: hypothetical protein JWN18_85 [Parcubacteria group bacterium]|nr:hypothetical protein [Parcubacteria group bacterium]
MLSYLALHKAALVIALFFLFDFAIGLYHNRSIVHDILSTIRHPDTNREQYIEDLELAMSATEQNATSRRGRLFLGSTAIVVVGWFYRPPTWLMGTLILLVIFEYVIEVRARRQREFVYTKLRCLSSSERQYFHLLQANRKRSRSIQ